MRIQVIADIHGRTIWKQQVDLSCDRIVFLGDYVDSFDEDDETILNNLADIIEFKKSDPEKVVLLIGNHCGQYCFSPNERNLCSCSGYRYQMHWSLWMLYNSNKELFQLAYQHNNYLFTHAGVHRGWYNYRALPQIIELGYDMPQYTISDQLNALWDNRKSSIFDCGYYRGGSQQTGGPLWCDKGELKPKPIKGYRQVVGHSKVREPRLHSDYGDESTSVMFCDTENKDIIILEI